LFAHHVIKGGVQPAGFEGLTGFYFLSPIPPMGSGVLEDVLPGGFYGLGSRGFVANLEMGGGGLFF
jgi:hypothetical protein